jgi:hypothetical protein
MRWARQGLRAPPGADALPRNKNVFAERFAAAPAATGARRAASRRVKGASGCHPRGRPMIRTKQPRRGRRAAATIRSISGLSRLVILGGDSRCPEMSTDGLDGRAGWLPKIPRRTDTSARCNREVQPAPRRARSATPPFEAFADGPASAAHTRCSNPVDIQAATERGAVPKAGSAARARAAHLRRRPGHAPPPGRAWRLQSCPPSCRLLTGGGPHDFGAADSVSDSLPSGLGNVLARSFVNVIHPPPSTLP